MIGEGHRPGRRKRDAEPRVVDGRERLTEVFHRLHVDRERFGRAELEEHWESGGRWLLERAAEIRDRDVRGALRQGTPRRVPQDADRVGFAGRLGPHHVLGDLLGRRALGSQQLGGPTVPPGPIAREQVAVDGRPHERVHEREWPFRPEDLGAQQRIGSLAGRVDVDPRERRGLAQRRAVGLAVAEDRDGRAPARAQPRGAGRCG